VVGVTGDRQWFDFDLSPAISVQVKTRFAIPGKCDLSQKLKHHNQYGWCDDIFDHFLIQQAQKQGLKFGIIRK